MSELSQRSPQRPRTPTAAAQSAAPRTPQKGNPATLEELISKIRPGDEVAVVNLLNCRFGPRSFAGAIQSVEMDQKNDRVVMNLEGVVLKTADGYIRCPDLDYSFPVKEVESWAIIDHSDHLTIDLASADLVSIHLKR